MQGHVEPIITPFLLYQTPDLLHGFHIMIH